MKQRTGVVQRWDRGLRRSCSWAAACLVVACGSDDQGRGSLDRVSEEAEVQDAGAMPEQPRDVVSDPTTPRPSPRPANSSPPAGTSPGPGVSPLPEAEPEAEPPAGEPPVSEPEPVFNPSPAGTDNPTPVVPPTSLPTEPPLDLPPGNDADCELPAEAHAEDASNPDQVVGDGTPESCTADAFIDAVADGGVITFACGPEPVTITLDRPAKVFNDRGPKIVIDGGGLITLSGGGSSRILYMNTCDLNQVFTTEHCQDQDHPQLTVQNLTFVDANSKAEEEYDGGGAIWARGGRLKVVNSRFFNNVCSDVGPDVGGGALRAFSQYQGLPVHVVDSTFGAEGMGNECSNGGALSSIEVSWSIFNSTFAYNRAVGNGGNPASEGTPGGGSGGAIYNDGNTMTLSLCGTRIEHNEVNAFGSAIFFVSNDHSGNVVIRDSVITNNIGGSWYPSYPQISNHDDTPIAVTSSIIE